MNLKYTPEHTRLVVVEEEAIKCNTINIMLQSVCWIKKTRKQKLKD